jgi:hypothetical protein
MRYMLLIYGDPSEAPPEDRSADWMTVTQSMHADGVVLSDAPLQPVDTATTVRKDGDKQLLVDGPFAETKEQLLGYYAIEVDDIDQAIAYAGRLPIHPWGCVEVRPLAPMPAASDAPDGDRAAAR